MSLRNIISINEFVGGKYYLIKYDSKKDEYPYEYDSDDEYAKDIKNIIEIENVAIFKGTVPSPHIYTELKFDSIYERDKYETKNEFNPWKILKREMICKFEDDQHQGEQDDGRTFFILTDDYLQQIENKIVMMNGPKIKSRIPSTKSKRNPRHGGKHKKTNKTRKTRTQKTRKHK